MVHGGNILLDVRKKKVTFLVYFDLNLMINKRHNLIFQDNAYFEVNFEIRV